MVKIWNTSGQIGILQVNTANIGYSCISNVSTKQLNIVGYFYIVLFIHLVDPPSSFSYTDDQFVNEIGPVENINHHIFSCMSREMFQWHTISIY